MTGLEPATHTQPGAVYVFLAWLNEKIFLVYKI
jgi:hypothetical protein